MKKNYLFLFALLGFFFSSIAQETSEGFTYDSEARTYILYIPTTYNVATDTLPLVLALHGLGDTKEGFNNGNGLKTLAESEKFILVTPQAENPTETVTVGGFPISASTIFQNAWHSGAGGESFEFGGQQITLTQPYYLSETRDDVGFISALIDTVSANFSVDSNRVYSTGFSMGAFMTNKLGCELSDKIAAIASVAGTIGNENINNCNPNAIIPALHIHSIDDGTVAYTNSGFGMDAVDNVAFWVANNNCNTMADTTDYTAVANDGFVSQRLLYAEGDSTSEVEFYHLEGPGHVWGQADFNTASTIWEFFSRHEKVRTIGGGEDTVVITPSAINNLEVLAFEMYPNPTTGKTTLAFLENESIQSITITNAIGKAIINRNFNKTINSFSFDMTSQSKGVYFIQIEDKKGNKSVRRLIKK